MSYKRIARVTALSQPSSPADSVVEEDTGRERWNSLSRDDPGQHVRRSGIIADSQAQRHRIDDAVQLRRVPNAAKPQRPPANRAKVAASQVESIKPSNVSKPFRWRWN